MKTRPAAIRTAAMRSRAPAVASKPRTANAIASETLAWSLGNEASVAVDHGWLIACVSYGRGRSQIEWMTKFATNALAAAAKPLPAVSFHLLSPPGRAKNQSAAVATTIN